jgi:hypothetical protein
LRRRRCVAPHDRKRLADNFTPLLQQLALSDFIAEGHLERHVRGMALQLYFLSAVINQRGRGSLRRVANQCSGGSQLARASFYENQEASMKESNLEAPGGEDARPSALLTPEERYNRIAEAAYLRAAARGFVGGDSMQDWLAAEAELWKVPI